MKKVNDMLTEELGTEITNLSNLEPGSEEHTAAVNSLDKLYNMKLDSIKVENEIQKFEKEIADRKRDRQMKVGMTILGGIGTFFAYDYWQTRGYKFEEFGSVASTTFRNITKDIFKMLKKK